MFKSTLSPVAQKALALLGESCIVKDGYLAGGSALALHFGHRFSFDFDFFSPVKFDPRKMNSALKKLGTFRTEMAKGISVIGEFQTVKFSYFHYKYPLLRKTMSFMGVEVAHQYDIAAMKLVAIMDRGTKRDFVDLYEHIQQGLTLEQMFVLYDKKYGVFESNRFSLIKSIGYFGDAEASDIPKMIRKLTWDQVKTFFAGESLRLGKKFLGDQP